MKRIFSRATRALFGSLLAIGLLTAAQADESTSKERKDFRALLEKIAEHSQNSALTCTEVLEQGQNDFSYRLALKNEPLYVGAYFLVFTPVPEGRVWSTLIAYEGKRGFVMGTLSVKRNERTVIYQHSFRGFFTDVTRLVIENDIPKELRYSKFGTGSRPVQEVICPIH